MEKVATIGLDIAKSVFQVHEFEHLSEEEQCGDYRRRLVVNTHAPGMIAKCRGKRYGSAVATRLNR